MAKCQKEQKTDSVALMKMMCDGKDKELDAVHEKMHVCMMKGIQSDKGVQEKRKKIESMSEEQKKAEIAKIQKEMKTNRQRAMKCRVEIMKTTASG